MIPPDLGLDLVLLEECNTSLTEAIRDAALGGVAPAVAALLRVDFDEPPRLVDGDTLVGHVQTSGGSYAVSGDGSALSYDAESFRFRATVSASPAGETRLDLIEFVPACWPKSPAEWPDEV